MSEAVVKGENESERDMLADFEILVKAVAELGLCWLLLNQPPGRRRSRKDKKEIDG